MSAADPQQLTLGLLLLAASLYVSAIWFLSPARRTWFTAMSAPSGMLLGALFLAVSLLELPSWRAQVLSQQITEFPLYFVLASVCVAHAGWSPGRRAASPEVAKRTRLRAVLLVAPWVLLASWLLVGVLGMIWPWPAYEPFAPAPPRFLTVACIPSLPLIFYSALAGWLFVKASGPTNPARKLRLKNLSYGVGTFAWGGLVLNASTLAAERVLLRSEIRVPLASLHLILEQILLATSVAAFGLGLSLRYAPRVNETVLNRSYPSLLRLLDRFEARRWHLVSGGRIRRLIATTHYTEKAAELLGLGEDDLEKALTTVQLTAIITNAPDDEAEEITPERVRDLLALLERDMRGGGLASKVKWAKYLNDTGERQSLASAPIREALEASLRLTAPDRSHDRPYRFGLEHTLWYHLAVVATAAAGTVSRRRVAEASGDQQLMYLRASRAYRTAERMATFPMTSFE